MIGGVDLIGGRWGSRDGWGSWVRKKASFERGSVDWNWADWAGSAAFELGSLEPNWVGWAGWAGK